MMRSLLIAVSIALCSMTATAAPTPPVVRHDITAALDPATQRLTATDRLTVPGALVSPSTTFSLNAALKVRNLTPGIELDVIKSKVTGAYVGMDRDSDRGETRARVNVYRLKGAAPGKDVSLELAYDGKIDTPITTVGEEYARGFSQTPGLIEARGAYLAGSTVWIPQIEGALVTYRLAVEMPKNWKSVSQGQRTESGPKGAMWRDVWEIETPTEEAHLIAASFTEYTRDAGGVVAAAFLRTPDEAIAARYLEVTQQYMDMYRAMIGPYPYSKFALVENFWETGYGMPSFTLLGEQIIRFPFILHSSYPHELLHNWWGNGVFVDFASGNWCEGLTAYLADHLVAEQNGQGDLHRRDILLRVSDHVTDKTDFPLSQFKSRYSPATEAIGYGKTAMVFDMLRAQIGDKAFVAGLQRFYRDNKFRPASFDDIRIAFEAVSGRDLKPYFEQWVTRSGIPDLRLARAETKGNRLTVTVTQQQSGKPVALDVPVVIHAGGKAVREIIAFSGAGASETRTFDLAAPAERIEVDPAFNVYRRLSPLEVQTSLSKAFGAEKALIVLPSTSEAALYAGLVKSWAKAGLDVVRDSEISDFPADRAVWVIGASNKLVPLIDGALKAEGVSLDADGAMIAGTRYAAASKSLTVVARHPKAPASAVVFVSATT
ncbi:MAG: peptidase M28, partial [Alphaproteobacteria bacterium]|nr:peptidase M28 [Alphaproteobacteria bacterium]